MKALWDELDNYLEVPSCEHCDSGAKCIHERDSDRSLEFCMGLNSETFGTLRSNILSMNPEPDLDKIYSLVIQEEQQRQISHGQEQTSAAYAARNFSGPNLGTNRHAGGDSKFFCDYCRKPGHTQKFCWLLHGRPTDKAVGSDGRGRGKNRKGQIGGIQPMKTNGTPREHQAGGISANAVQSMGPSNSHHSSPLPGITDAQFQRLLSLAGSDDQDTEQLSGPHLEDDDWCW